ncbi:ParA family protein [Rummeliibacillus sp. SL167]|uniref:ParA family protein n=1 Tax=Rummeliibacillus sp. SL167 TaxID=2579792 RepID=UPI0011B83ABA|nr:AAA family ATPase [Rummeliibacillus sp. SL167]
MKIVSLFNNKGGVGKSTLGFHLGCALGELGKKVLLIDLDPQCNMTISGVFEDSLHQIWQDEDLYIDDYGAAIEQYGLEKILSNPRSIHFLLKPTEDGLNELTKYPPVIKLYDNVDLIPGRLSLHKYENKLAERWSGLYQSDNLSIRTVTNIRRICEVYGKLNGYDYVLIDTSPSLGILNKVIISTVDGFIIPALPDMFSVYGIRNIGNSLQQWQKEFETIYKLISEDKRTRFPEKFVQFLGYTIYNAKKQSKQLNEYDLAVAHYAYAKEMPKTVEKYIVSKNRAPVADIMSPIGGIAVMHSHNTFPSVAQALKCSMWLVPQTYKDYKENDPELLDALLVEEPNPGHFKKYKETQENYHAFAKEFIERAEVL